MRFWEGSVPGGSPNCRTPQTPFDSLTLLQAPCKACKQHKADARNMRRRQLRNRTSGYFSAYQAKKGRQHPKHFTVQLDYLQGTHEWRNIPPVIQQAFVSLFNKVNSQNHLIKELQTKQISFVQQQDFTAALASKVSLQEHAFKSAKVLMLTTGLALNMAYWTAFCCAARRQTSPHCCSERPA